MLRIAFLVLLCCFSLFAEMMKAYVVAVSDGDTIKVIDADKKQYRIRLWGIDAPEKDQAFGQKSKQYLSKLVFNKNITIDSHGEDQYGRILGRIYVDKIDVDLEMVKAGMAWHYVHFAKDAKELADAQVEAKKKKVGLWADPNPIEPYQFRKSQKEKKSEKINN